MPCSSLPTSASNYFHDHASLHTTVSVTYGVGDQDRGGDFEFGILILDLHVAENGRRVSDLEADAASESLLGSDFAEAMARR